MALHNEEPFLVITESCHKWDSNLWSRVRSSNHFAIRIFQDYCKCVNRYLMQLYTQTFGTFYGFQAYFVPKESHWYSELGS